MSGRAYVSVLRSQSPVRALEHQRVDTFFASAGMRYGHTGSFESTRKTRLDRDRALRGGPFDFHLPADALWTLRETSRDLYNNSCLIRGAVERIPENVIHTGFAYRPDTGDEGLDSQIAAYLESWFAGCDERGEFHFWDNAYQSERNEVRDGDTFWYLDPRGQDGRGSVSIVEGDRCLSPLGQDGKVLDNGITIWNGCERTPNGKPLRYWFADEAPRHQYATDADGDWYPAFPKLNPDPSAWRRGGALHAYFPDRFTGTRGTPWFSAAVREVDDLDAILVAERVAMRLSAARATYEKIDDPMAYTEAMGTIDPKDFHASEETWEPGEHRRLPPGASVGVVEHNRPGDNFQSFIETELRLMGVAVGLPIEFIMLDFSRPNFAAQRLSLQVAYRRFIRRQVQKERNEFTPIRRFALARGIAAGDLPNRPEVYRMKPVGYPRWPYIDPGKDVDANAKAIAAGLKTRRQAIAENTNDDPEQVLTEWELEMRRFGPPMMPTSASFAPQTETNSKESADE